MASFPAKIGKYDVEGIIGHGGMGVVYKAVDSQIGRHVAIKMINSGGDASLIERFRAEARNTGSLHCPNIVTVYNVGEQDGNPYLVMQFLEGPSLESMIQQGISLGLAERLGIVIDVCNGLAYAHQRNVIHRDIKPANIIVLKDGMNDGMAVIVDFGIARIMGDTHLTRGDQLVGSLPYMSAEQLLAEDLDNRTDIYSTGVVLFQLLTGSLPFEAKETPAILFKILNQLPPPLSSYLNDYPPQLQEIVNRVLAKKRDDRYSSAKDLAFDLMQLQGRLKSEAVAQMLRRAEDAVTQQDWAQANEHLLQVLRIDRQNTNAQKMMTQVQERLRHQQELERVRGLRSQADEACKERRYDEALRLIDQALTLDTKNNDLVAFRDSVKVAKDKAIVLRRALRRAEAALQDGDLAEAEAAINDALQIDAEDTQAKALKVIVAQRFEENSRQEKLQGLLDQARGQIAAGDLSGAFTTLKIAQEVDSTSVEFQKVAAIAAAAREQERRRAETEELRRKIENALVQEDFAAAVTLAEEGLRRFPTESTLLKLKGLAETQRARVEQRKFVREQFATATSLADSGQAREALSTLDRALQRVPANPELESLRSTVRKRVEEEESQQRRLQAIKATVDEAKRILQKQGAKSAKEFLETQASQFSDSPQVQEIIRAVRLRAEIETLDQSLAHEPNPARRLKLAETAARSSPNNQDIQRRLAALQQERAQISAAIDRARSLENSERFSDAIKEWQKLKKTYPRVPEFESEIDRLEALKREAKKKGKTPVSQHLPVQDDKSIRPTADFSATRMLGSESETDSAATAEFERPAAYPVDGGETNTTQISARESFQQKLAAFEGKQQLTELLAGPRKYIAIAGLVVIIVSIYLVMGRPKTTPQPPHPPAQIRITPTPPDAKISLDSQPLAKGIVSVPYGGTVSVEVSRLGYKTKPVEIRQDSDGNIVLEPEPVHLSMQTPEKTGVVQLDGNKIADLTDGNMDEYLLSADGNAHQLSVTARGRQLFAIQVHVLPGNVPQVDAFDVNGMLLITTLGNAGRLYAGSQLKNVRLGDQKIEPSPSGVDFSIIGPDNQISFGEGKNQGSVPLASSNAPMLAVYSPNMGGQVEITTNVALANATLKVNDTPVTAGRHGWLVSKQPGDYTFELSANGYEPQTWKMTLQRGQVLPTRNVPLTPKTTQPATASLVIISGTAEASVSIDGALFGRLDINGNLQTSKGLSEGPHTLILSKTNYESRTFPIAVKAPEYRLTDAKLTPWPRLIFQTSLAGVKIDYKRAGDSQEIEVTASDKPIVRPGQYELKAHADGFEDFRDSSVTVSSGEDKIVVLTFQKIQDYLFQDPKQITHSGEEWVKANDSHKWVYLKPGNLHVTLIFRKPSGRILFFHKKPEWVVEDAGTATSVQYVLDSQKLVRKLVPGDQSDQKEVKVDATADPLSLSVHIQADGSHLTVSNDKGVVLDDYTVPGNFSAARLGIKSESEFVVRKN
jgi:serine/threonine-protein kinase